MSKTVSTCLLETNQIQGKPQENVFFHSLYRTEPEFISEYLRTARSTSPIQICAIFSTTGPDNLSAILNIELCKALGAIVDKAQKQPVLDFDNFSREVVSTLNNRVCNYIVAKGGTPLKTSMTMMVVEGDILRIIHIGNTKAVLFRDRKIMALTEEQTVAHRYVQMGAITAEQEKTHPERDTLTQYLGKMPQDGELVPEKKVNIKLKDNDEIYLMGYGISKAIPQQMRNMVICKDMSTEDKARDIVISAVNYGVKYGLSMVAMKVESTFLLPGDAVIASNIPNNEISTEVKKEKKEDPYVPFNEPVGDSSVDDDMGDTATFAYGKVSDDASEEVAPEGKNSKAKTILIDVGIVLGIMAVFAGIAFGVSYLVMKNKGWISTETTTMPTMVETTVASEVEVDTNAYYEETHMLFAINDTVKVYAENDQASTVLADLVTNQQVMVIGEDETGLYYVVDYNGTYAYALKPLLSEYETIESAPSTVETAQTSIPHGGGVQPTVDQTPTTTTTAATEAVDPNAPVDNPGEVVTDPGEPAATEATTAETPAATEATTTEAPATEAPPAPADNPAPAEGGEV